MNAHDIIISILVIAALVVLGKVVVPIGQALARRIEGKTTDPGELEELRGRVAALEIREARVLELEERLDFAERVLAQQRSRELDDADTPPEALPAAR